MRSACSGLDFLHTEYRTGSRIKYAIAHRDIKSKNILVKNDGNCCIADFGLAVCLRDGIIDLPPPQSDSQRQNSTRVGTKRYMAPEVLSETLRTDRFDDFKMADMYSMALVMWEILIRIEIDGKSCLHILFRLIV